MVSRDRKPLALLPAPRVIEVVLQISHSLGQGLWGGGGGKCEKLKKEIGERSLPNISFCTLLRGSLFAGYISHSTNINCGLH